MNLARIGPRGAERPIVIVDDTAYAISELTTDIDGTFLASAGIDRVRAALASDRLPIVDIDGERYGSPIARPGMLLCVGLNYRKHAAETGAEIPTEPILFSKASRCVIGPNDDVLIPRKSRKTDYEVELAVVIGSTASYLDSPDDALGHVAGYTIANDLSEREFQLERGGQWVKGKSCDTFNPLGPWLVPVDEAEGDSLGVELSVNGEMRQRSNTADMIFGVRHLVWYVSQFMVLEPGDVINTGTPEGVALGRPNQPYLRAGDEIRVAIDGLGVQRQRVGQA